MPEITMIKQRSFIIAGLLLALLVGCARLPDYATPRSGRLIDPTLMADAFTYRQLKRSDFKAPSLPAESNGHAHEINAHTCAQIRPTAASRFRVSHSRYGQTPIYIGSVEQLAFEAVMIPGCSWWNPAMPKAMEGYVLQHEQIHFALVELSARRLTRETRDAAKKFLAIQPTLEAARAELMTTIGQWIRAAMDASLPRHAAFDEETSLLTSPQRQRWWRETVQAELRENAP